MNEKQYGLMPINKLFLKLAIPGLISMAFSLLGIIIDGAFVGRYLVSDALAAINLILPIAAITFALGDMLAIGSSVKISIKLGEKDELSASRIFSASLLLISLLGLLISCLALTNVDKIISFFISDQSLATYAYDYVYVFLIFLPLIMPFFAIDNYLKACGKIKFSMYLNIFCAISNIILDFILIGYLNLGIEWAAFATIIGQVACVIIVLIPFALNKYALKFTLPIISLNDLIGIAYNGS